MAGVPLEWLVHGSQTQTTAMDRHVTQLNQMGPAGTAMQSQGISPLN